MNLTDRAYQVIKTKLIRLELPPGSLFTEADLATELGISKTPVREALARLARDDLVEANARSGYRVLPVTLKVARDLFALRALLEGEAAALAAKHMTDPDQLVGLEELCKASYHPEDRDSIARFLEANTQFHWTIAGAGGNMHLARMLRQILDQLERVFHIGLSLTSRADEIVHEHTELVGALVSGDDIAAREIAVTQVYAAQKMVMDALLASPALTSASVTLAKSALPRRRRKRQPRGISTPSSR